MDSVKYIFSKPQFIEGVGNIYPIKVIDNDEFNECSNIILYSKNHFNIDDIEQYKLLDILISVFNEEAIKKLTQLFSLVLRKDVSFIIADNYYGFRIDDTNDYCDFRINNNIINSDNYDTVREIILKQNILFEPKVFKNKLVQQWAEKVLEARRKNGVKITMEDMITTVKVYEGISYEEVANMSLYQLYADFKRISKLMGYEKDITFLAAGADIKNIEHYAEEVDMFEDPYGNIFVKKEKLNSLNKALGQK